MSGIVGLVLVVAVLVVVGVTLVVVGRRRERRRGYAGDLVTPREDRSDTKLPQAGENKGSAWFSSGWGGGVGGGGDGSN